MAKLTDEDIERIAERVAEKIGKPNTQVLPSPIWIDPRYAPQPYWSPFYPPQVTC